MERRIPKNNRSSRGTAASRRGSLAIAVWALALATTQAVAAPGDLDPTFGDHGRVRVGLAGSGDTGPGRMPVAQQADGRILVAGRNPDGSAGVTRLTPDGTADATFGTSGTARVDFGPNGPATIRAIAIAADGRILIAGHVVIDSRSGARDIAVARLMPNGSLDGTFGSGGRVTLDLRAGADDTANAMVIQPDGRIALAGSSAGSAGDSTVALARLMPDGTADAGFGTAGRAFLGTVTGGATAYGLVMQSDGKLVGCGSASNFAAVFRVLANGTPDLGFGSSPGWSYVAEGAAYDCAVRPDGRLLLAVMTYADAIVLQLSPKGIPDGRFGLSLSPIGLEDGVPRFGCDVKCGTYDTGFEWYPESAADVLLLPDGELILAGINVAGELGLTRVDANGIRVATFSRGGSRIYDLGHDSLAATLTGAAVLLQQDGKLMAVGSGGIEPTLVRILMDDSPGTSVIGLTEAGLEWIEPREPQNSVSFVVRRTGGNRGAVSVDYALVNGSARAPEDFVAGRGTVAWPDGDASARVVGVRLVGDSVMEDPEEFRIVLSNPSGAGIAIADARVTLRESPAGEIGFGTDVFEVAESAGSVTLKVHRTGGYGGAVSVQYRTVELNNGAKAGADFTATSGTLRWEHGDDTPRSIVIPITQDSLKEFSETFLVLLELPTGGAMLPDPFAGTGQATVVILGEPPASVAPKPTTSGGGGGGGSSGPALLSLLALLMISASRRKAQLGLAVRH